MIRAAARAAALALVTVFAGCAAVPEDAGLDAGRRIDAELADTPFFPQRRYQCGPAALATILVASGVPTSADALVDRVYVPARKGSLQIEMSAATRGHGRIAYEIAPSLDAIAAEIAEGRPVLVLQNLGVRWLPRWHYAVVVGIDSSEDRVILRSGVDRRRQTPIPVFLRTWQRSGFWGLVALPPGELPAAADANRYFRAVADLEATGRDVDAALAWKASLKRWPGSATPAFGLGNIALAGGRHDEALDWYDTALQREPGHLMTRNNMAYALAGLGRRDEALAVLEAARADAGGDALAVIDDSLAELRSEP